MSNESLDSEPLEAIAEKIARYADEADERLIEAANLVREARQRIEAGELGEVRWTEWAPKNIKLSTTRLWELQRIADADDPRQELERLREQTRKRVERHRENQRSAPLRNGDAVVTESATLEEDRERLMTWARKAPLDRVADVLSYIERFDAANSTSDTPAEAAAGM